MPRQARLAISSVACCCGSSPSAPSQKRALTLAHPDQGDREQLRRLRREAGVVGDHLGDRLGAQRR